MVRAGRMVATRTTRDSDAPVGGQSIGPLFIPTRVPQAAGAIDRTNVSGGGFLVHRGSRALLGRRGVRAVSPCGRVARCQAIMRGDHGGPTALQRAPDPGEREDVIPGGLEPHQNTTSRSPFNSSSTDDIMRRTAATGTVAFP